jgi:two-component system, cell cycle sensor histidine kinase and response regulator CckA
MNWSARHSKTFPNRQCPDGDAFEIELEKQQDTRFANHIPRLLECAPWFAPSKPLLMSIPLRVLLLEDRPSDARLVLHELKAAGFTADCERVDCQADFVARLGAPWDVILADYSLPQFDAPSALRIVRERNLDTPFIIVSGTIGEELAVAAMKEGAADYLLKDRLSRLGPAIRQAIEQRQLRTELRQAQRMEAIGRLAGGVAHDFNNLLTIMLGYSDVAIEQLRQGDPLREIIEEIRKAAIRATALTRQLLAFSRKQVLRPAVLDLNGLITDLEKMLGRLIGEDIKLVVQPADELWPVLADPGQVEQVLLNLAVNARDAMPQGGTLRIETANAQNGGAPSRQPSTSAREFVLLTVSDTGLGMSRETLAHIFEPFFTTKGPDKGTGLGLATVYGIVKQSGGHVAVDSELGHGTVFKVYLPRHQKPVALESDLDANANLQGEETILLVEDDEAVRTLAKTALERLGYIVLVAADGEEALRLAQQNNEHIHLLATDVIMPYVGGHELAQRLTARRPTMKVLYLSGYMDDAVVRQGLVHNRVPFLQKPYTPQSLVSKVREVLDAKTPA